MLSKKIKTIIYIDGMHCEHCANKVKTNLENIKSIKSIKINLQKKEATILSTTSLDKEQIKKIINDLGYKVTKFIEC